MKARYQVGAVLLLFGFVSTSFAEGVACEATPHTRIELSICSEPLLQNIDEELSASVSRALEQDRVDQTGARDLRNDIAQKCRREPDETLAACLLAAEVTAYQSISERLGEYVPAAALELPMYGDKRVGLLTRQLEIAESSFALTGDPEFTVQTTLALMQLLEQQRSGTQADVGIFDSLSALQLKVQDGCQHPQYGAHWRAAMAKFKAACVSPQLYSALEID